MTGAELGALLCIVLLGYWLAERHLAARKAVLGCTHERLEVRQMRKEYGGTLFLECAKHRGGCGYQAHLHCLRPLPDGTWHLDREGTEEEQMLAWQQAWQRAIRLRASEEDA